MARDPRYDILFEPIKIGPVTARNRFYQVPHCNGGGRQFPTQTAVMRGVKAEGGWAVVCTEQCDIHYSSSTPHCVRLWDEQDIAYLARMTEQVHRHESLAGVEFVHMGYHAACFESREPPMAPSGRAGYGVAPIQARAMDKTDIRNYRRWHRTAALNARKAGFDIIVVYAGHDLSLPMHFLARRHNQRTDEYGGSLENRARLFREVLEETKEAVGDTCGVVVRFAVEELLGEGGVTVGAEGHDVVAMLAEIPDLWDVNCAEWENDSITARFAEEGFQEPYIGFVKKLTTKPVVAVGRYTSPDRMVSLIRGGVLDMIGAARASIADPFLPKKIEEGRIEDIRECIGCNVCVSGEFTGAPMRCTQNPTQGEEWRRGWHPERIPAKEGDDTVLVVGAGPAGLEAARALGQRGYKVTLAEATSELGGRATREARLPGLATWARVKDYRIGQIAKMPNVEVYRGSRMTAAEVRETGCSLVAVATGAHWRKDGVGRVHSFPIPGSEGANVFTADDVMAGTLPEGPVVLFDDEHFYLASVVAEALALAGRQVIYVTPQGVVAPWSTFTLEQGRIQRRLLERGVEIVVSHSVAAVDRDGVELACVYTGRKRSRACRSVVMVTSMAPIDGLYHELMADENALAKAGIRRVARIGDCYAPGLIAAAVQQGYKFARDLGAPMPERAPFRRENVELAALA
ncbi:MAG: NADH:flavin oxidoreductase [Alphaproteobacteria bacterium]|nr:NADH:flavin oxidoreductase [Alphaproteobacteria bacterium]